MGQAYQKREPSQAQQAKTQALAVRNQQVLSTQQQLAAEIGKSLPSAVRTIEDMQKAFEELRGKANLITPMSSVNSMLPMHQISLRVAVIDPTVTSDGNGSECYRGSFCEENERALGKVALDKLEALAGVVRVPELSGRCDDRSEPDYCEFQVTLRVTDFDGTVRTVTATKELDLRRGAPETLKPQYKKDPATGWSSKTGEMEPISEANLTAKRTHKLRLCESKARLAALREALAIKQKYTLEELSKPFVVPMLVPDLDMNDPEVKTAFIQKTLGIVPALYGPTPKAIGPGTGLPEGAVLPPSTVVQGERLSDEPEHDGEPGTEFSDEELAAQESVQQQTAPPVATENDVDGFGTPPAKPDTEPILCGCTCGHQVEIAEKVANYTLNAVGSLRCGACYPWNAKYDVGAHKHLGSLQLKNRPEITAALAEEEFNQFLKQAEGK